MPKPPAPRTRAACAERAHRTLGLGVLGEGAMSGRPCGEEDTWQLAACSWSCQLDRWRAGGAGGALLWGVQTDFKRPLCKWGTPGSLGPPELPRVSAQSQSTVRGTHGALAGRSDPSPGSPQRARRRLPHRQARVQKQRSEAAHCVPTRQAGPRRPLLHQPGQPRAGALADLGARVLELRGRSKCQSRRGPRRGCAALPPGSARSPPLAALRAPASPFLAAPPPARRPPLPQSRSPPLPPRPDSRP